MDLNTVSMVVSWIVGLGGLGGFIGTLAKIGPDRRKLNADLFRAGLDSAKEVNDATKALVGPYLEQIKFLRDELDAARGEVASLRLEIADLRRAGLSAT